MIGQTNRFKADLLGSNFFLEVGHLKICDAMAASDHLTPECGERMDVTGNWRADDPEVLHAPGVRTVDPAGAARRLAFAFT